MRNALIIALLSTWQLRAADLSASEVMNKVRDVYLHASSLHIVVEREDRVAVNGRSGSESSQLELAEHGRRNYYARMKRDGVEAVAISDGETTWKALPSKKQWTQVGAALSGNEDEPSAPSKDLRSFVSITTVGQFIAIAQFGQEFSIEKNEDVKVGNVKFPCYVIHARTPQAEYELWVDRERFYVLQCRQRSVEKGAVAEIRTRTSLIEMNTDVPKSFFHLEPGKGWSEQEMLVLPGDERALLTGSRAANFALKSLEGEAMSLDQVHGKVVVLDFWATWCPPCRAELPSIEKLRTEFAGKVEFLGVNDEESGTVKSFVKKNNYEMTVLMDGKRQVHHQYGVHSIPTLLIIDKQGVIRSHFIGQRSEKALRAAIESALTSR